MTNPSFLSTDQSGRSLDVKADDPEKDESRRFWEKAADPIFNLRVFIILEYSYGAHQVNYMGPTFKNHVVYKYGPYDMRISYATNKTEYNLYFRFGNTGPWSQQMDL